LNASKSKSNRDPLYVFCLIGAAMFSAYGLAQDLSPEIRADVDRRINLQRKWDEHNNSPGAELQAVEVLRTNKVVTYELRAKDLPLDRKYELLILPTMARSINDLTATGDVEIDKKDGRVLDGPGDVRTLILPAPAPGEPYRFALVSKDGKYKAFATVLPNPIEAMEKGCRVRVIRLTPKFELAFIQFTGFPPQAEISGHGNSAGEIHDFKVTVNSDGYADIGILPFKAGKSNGTMDVQASTPKCAPKVSFRWGSTE
jgi:hypothetical protein